MSFITFILGLTILVISIFVERFVLYAFYVFTIGVVFYLIDLKKK